MVRATGIESNGGADEDIAIDTPAMSAAVIGDIIDALAGVLSCSREVIELAVMTLVAGGHLLLEDVPGVGETTLARALGHVMGGSSRRIQFTPDLLPSDLTGVSVYSQATGSFDFHPGPLFANRHRRRGQPCEYEGAVRHAGGHGRGADQRGRAYPRAAADSLDRKGP